jgi:hypothetical protein
MGMGLASSLITLTFSYLSWTYGVLRRLKTRRLHWHTSSILVPGTIIINNLEQNPKRKPVQHPNPLTLASHGGFDPFPAST